MSLIESHVVPYGEFQVYSTKPNLPLTKVKQIHSPTIVDLSLDDKKNWEEIEADGMVYYQNSKISPPPALGIVTADCLPIFIAGQKGVAMLHAGWRGLHQKIIKRDEIIKLEPYFALIGPHICQHHYQVGEEFLDHFPNSSCLIKDPETDGKYLLSLQLEAQHQLKELNPDMELEVSNLCTFEHPSLHSFRKDGTTSRNWNLFIYRE